MSHEIRTPMNGILGMTRLALDMKYGQEQTKILGNVLYSAESLLGILNDILDFSKISAGKLQLAPHDFDLQIMLDNLITSLAFQATDKNIFLKDNTDFSLVPKWIHADELRLQQILMNIIGNAIKFTSEGGVTVEISQNSSTQQKVSLTFSVVDTGIGLAPDKQEIIFNSFSQADSSTTRLFGGTGLGLAISKQLVEMMGGRISIKSQEGEGCTFHFTIAVPVGRETSPPDAPVLHSNYINLRILLVEDNKINQDLARIVLEKDGQQVVIARDGLEALNILACSDFDLILMDLQMPNIDGLLATEIIRNCEQSQVGHHAAPPDIEEKLVAKIAGGHIPIISMTANVMENDQLKCKAAGMDDFLSKPFIPAELFKILNTFARSGMGKVEHNSVSIKQ